MYVIVACIQWRYHSVEKTSALSMHVSARACTNSIVHLIFVTENRDHKYSIT